LLNKPEYGPKLKVETPKMMSKTMKYTRTRLLPAMALSFSSLGAAAQAPDNAPLFTPAENTLLSPAPLLASGPLFPGVLGQALADFDNDGDLDLFVTNSEGLPNYLYLNDGNGHFHDVATQAGVALSDSYSVSVGVGDFNNDGLLDILVGGRPAQAANRRTRSCSRIRGRTRIKSPCLPTYPRRPACLP
jgi:hypothetical protein